MNELLIFAKSPKVGETKTRLIPSMGAEQACDAHRRLVEDTLARFQDFTRATVRLCVTELTDETRDWAQRYDLALETQKGTDLGRRMHSALSSALDRVPAVALIGSDCPMLDQNYVDQAFAALQRTDLVIGPAVDGGYVLIGARGAAPAALFDEIPWGTGEVMAATRRAIQDLEMTSAELAPLWDVDTPADWARFLRLRD